MTFGRGKFSDKEKRKYLKLLNLHGKPVIANEGVLEIFMEAFPERTESSIRSNCNQYVETTPGKFIPRDPDDAYTKATKRKVQEAIEAAEGKKEDTADTADTTTDNSKKKKKTAAEGGEKKKREKKEKAEKAEFTKDESARYLQLLNEYGLPSEENGEEILTKFKEAFPKCTTKKIRDHMSQYKEVEGFFFPM